MPAKSSRVFVALATVAVVGASVIGANAASAAAPRLAGRHARMAPAAKFTAAGTYEATVPIARLNSQLVITPGATTPNAGTFEFVDIGDYGDWVIQGHAIAMQVASSVSGHAGVVLVGQVSPAGTITGYVGIPGFGEVTWSAVRDTATPAARARVAASMRSAAAESQRPGNAFGTYTAEFPSVPLSDTLNLVHDPFSTRSGHLTFVDLADTGNWVQMGKHIAIGVATGQDAGVTMIATRTTSGLDTAASPGIYIQPSSGVFAWYATKTS
jgi:hypothetical protein